MNRYGILIVGIFIMAFVFPLYGAAKNDSARPDSLRIIGDIKIKNYKFVNFCYNIYKWADHTFNSYDSLYVVGTNKDFNARLKSDNWIDFYFLSFEDMTNVNLVSDGVFNVGASVSYKAITVSYMREVKNFFRNAPKAKNKLDFSFICSRIGVDLSYYKTQGDTKIKKLGSWTGSCPFEGVKSEQYGLDLYYIFNNKKYSQAAAYSISRIQKRSAGSFILGVSFASNDIDLDFSGLSDEMKEQFPHYGPSDYNYHFNYNDYNILVGYGYSCAISKNWLFNFTALPAIGFKHSKSNSIQGDGYGFSTNLKSKMAFIWNKSRYFGGLIMRYDGYLYASREYKFFNSILGANLCVGIRF